MPTTAHVEVKKLKIDLQNYRTMPQATESDSINAIIATRAEWFWALMESLMLDGYLPTENILVLKGSRGSLNVVEGNRRIAALKIIHGYVPASDFELPSHIAKAVATVPPEWKAANKKVPCAVYELAEAAQVKRMRSLIHGKAQRAGRADWTSVMKARHDRNENGIPEPGLDLLEKYLVDGKNLTPIQAARWQGDYPVTVLDEALGKIASRVGATSASDVAKKYPAGTYRGAIEAIVHAIGMHDIKFDTMRTADFAARYGVPPLPSPRSSGTPTPALGSGTASSSLSPSSTGGTSSGGASPAPAPTVAPVAKRKVVAVATHDPKQVKRVLRAFRPLGLNREKIATLRQEALHLDLDDNPIAFCFLLRSMFEISAKAYCGDHKAASGPSIHEADGKEKSLEKLLRDIYKHMTHGLKPTDPVVKELHGASTELSTPNGLLSITTMNQLVHNKTFTLTATDIATKFSNVFPFLAAMNS